MGLIAGTLFALQPAQAKTIKKKTVTFAWVPPCATVCSYNINLNALPSDPADAPSADPLDLLGETANGCTDPGPAGSYVDIIVTAPKGARALTLAAVPTVDWDTFICAKPKAGKTGSKLLAAGVNPAADAESAEPGCILGIPACPEKAVAAVKPGIKYVLRAFNYSDPLDLVGTYTFSG